MDKGYVEYVLKRIEGVVCDYTTMDRQDVADYVLTCLEGLKVSGHLVEYEKNNTIE